MLTKFTDIVLHVLLRLVSSKHENLHTQTHIIYMYICTYARMHTHTHTRTRTHTHTHTHTHAHTCTRIHIHCNHDNNYILALSKGLIQRGSNIDMIQYQRTVTADRENDKSNAWASLTFVAAQTSNGKRHCHAHTHTLMHIYILRIDIHI